MLEIFGAGKEDRGIRGTDGGARSRALPVHDTEGGLDGRRGSGEHRFSKEGETDDAVGEGAEGRGALCGIGFFPRGRAVGVLIQRDGELYGLTDQSIEKITW